MNISRDHSYHSDYENHWNHFHTYMSYEDQYTAGAE